MRVAFAAAAQRDLGAIIDYIAQDNPTAAEAVFEAIRTLAARLADFPEIGHAGRLPDTRELAVAGLPYLIVYQVVGETVTVVAVFHGARDLARVLAPRGKPKGSGRRRT